MKTNLNRKIATLEDAKSFLFDLHTNDEAYHPEDDALDITFKTCDPTEQERKQLNQFMDICFTFAGFDPCEYLCELLEDEESYVHNMQQYKNEDKEINF